MKTIIALGSNSNQEENISKAQILLKQRFKGIKFSVAQWTEPIGIKSDKFLNCLGTFETDISLTQVKQCLKEIEQTMGDSHESHQKGNVLIDIDLAQYGEEIVKEIIWL
jgi:7,8-dihydro-6-hydroxymethylpterin-pyrophosphokinase (HPPK)